MLLDAFPRVCEKSFEGSIPKGMHSLKDNASAEESPGNVMVFGWQYLHLQITKAGNLLFAML